MLPESGKLSEKRKQHEKQRWFRRGFRFRAGSRVASAYWIVLLDLIYASITVKKGCRDGLDVASWRTT